MKVLLSSLGVFGLIASTGSASVSCFGIKQEKNALHSMENFKIMGIEGTPVTMDPTDIASQWKELDENKKDFAQVIFETTFSYGINYAVSNSLDETIDDNYESVVSKAQDEALTGFTYSAIDENGVLIGSLENVTLILQGDNSNIGNLMASSVISQIKITDTRNNDSQLVVNVLWPGDENYKD